MRLFLRLWVLCFLSSGWFVSAPAGAAEQLQPKVQISPSRSGFFALPTRKRISPMQVQRAHNEIMSMASRKKPSMERLPPPAVTANKASSPDQHKLLLYVYDEMR